MVRKGKMKEDKIIYRRKGGRRRKGEEGGGTAIKDESEGRKMDGRR